ncbi:Alpha/Beta hydrolase protein [Polychytrium aggregatum]|uniref:Alpha/Beta hydrolase protein n=1 Tax=Polychytrium aggregatum TaxID=110093 RepID=UPI0022FEEEBD|nr:Alpha/Beta hydrolase protein [Polychytrium aggregatum]KAI9202007.1 Alpha/Beta hydrolase protein [Polychytrium aggregatum]
MLDHILGRPSPGLKRLEVLILASLTFAALKQSPSWPVLDKINKRLARFPPWKIVLGTLFALYLLNHTFLLCFLNAPEPLARMYTRNFYRATWVLTCLDAGFLTAMKIPFKPLRDFCSVAFSAMYMFFPDAADEKVRKFRALCSVEMMRTSWEKSLNPILRLLAYPQRGYLPIRRDITIPRPTPPSVSSFPGTKLGPITVRLYFDGAPEELKKCTSLILQVPGGGFVSMGPKCHDDYVSVWARKTKIPVVSIDYGKAPGSPYPWALEECFDAYRTITESNGEIVGLEGWFEVDGNGKRGKMKPPIKVMIVGDSAGGNLAASVVIKCLESKDIPVRPPSGLILIYPCLSFDLACWMPQEQLGLIRAESKMSLSMQSLVQAKETMDAFSPLAVPPAPKRIDVFSNKVQQSRTSLWRSLWRSQPRKQHAMVPKSLSMTSRMSYFTDRLLAPEMMRAMALMYLGGSPSPPNFDEDYYLSPIVAPDSILARFPKTFLICGEKDPFVDDTVIFGGRLRQAKQKARKEWESVKTRLGDLVVNAGRPHAHSKTATGRAPASTGSSESSESSGKVGRTFERVGLNGDDDEDEDSDDDSLPQTKILLGDLEIDIEEFQNHIFSKDPGDMVKTKILDGMSHAFLLMMSFLPEARQIAELTAGWISEIIDGGDAEVAGITSFEASNLTHMMMEDIEQQSSQERQGTQKPSVQGKAARKPQGLEEVSEKQILERQRMQLAKTHLK